MNRVLELKNDLSLINDKEVLYYYVGYFLENKFTFTNSTVSYFMYDTLRSICLERFSKLNLFKEVTEILEDLLLSIEFEFLDSKEYVSKLTTILKYTRKTDREMETTILKLVDSYKMRTFLFEV